MRYVILADIHSNLAAFQAVLTDMNIRGKFDEIWCLGDVVGYGPEPHACIELLRSYKHICIAGNHDWAAVGKINISDFNPDAAQACLWTAQQLNAQDIDYLQNLPVRGELGSKIRQAIIAKPGWHLIAADYSQIDLRALAHISQDPELIDAFRRDEDIHTVTASRVFNVPPDEVTATMRRAAKTINFGIIYGMSDYGLEQATDFSREEASQFIVSYFQKYPKVKEYIENKG